ncbi:MULTISPECIES: WG repeat-containing protein [Paenibacillus]|uniref:SLH domain-containing protein n=1 Tax=Paenibacillus odorifer TaxID=189426 RepID=A0ABX3HE89_9BACL|nr:WG repeat-containing protein [Paenibacillus odorifer]OMD48525.1 hypothetical protein BSK51_21580 [Paenibacillus odorifer]
MKKILFIPIIFLLTTGGISTAHAQSNSNFAIQPKFESVSIYDGEFTFSEGYAWVYDKDNSNRNFAGVIDAAGDWVIEPSFNMNFYSSGNFQFSEGLSRAKLNNEWVYIDYAGNIMFTTPYSKVGDFHEGLAAVQKGGKWGFINKTGKEVIKPQYDKISPSQSRDVSTPGKFSEGLAAVEKNGLWGYVNKKGEMIIPPKYGFASDFNDGRAIVFVKVGDSVSHYLVIDKQGKVISKHKEISDYKDGFAYFNDNNKFGIMDTSGKVIYQSSEQYSYLFGNREGVFLYNSFGHGDGVVDKQGKVLIKPQYEEIKPFSEGLSYVRVKKNNENYSGFIDKTGKEIIKLNSFDTYYGSFHNGLVSVRTKDGYGFIKNPLDVPSAWAKDEVNQAISLQLVPKAQQIEYSNSINRSDFSRLIVQLLEVKTGKSIDELLNSQGKSIDNNIFYDTKDRKILGAYALGLVSGTADGEYNPSGNITREEAAVILSRTAKFLGIDSESSNITYSDQKMIASWAQGAVKLVSVIKDSSNSAQLMGSTGDNKFSPKISYTRQQAFISMKRLFNAK